MPAQRQEEDGCLMTLHRNLNRNPRLPQCQQQLLQCQHRNLNRNLRPRHQVVRLYLGMVREQQMRIVHHVQLGNRGGRAMSLVCAMQHVPVCSNSMVRQRLNSLGEFPRKFQSPNMRTSMLLDS
jgi:hypothetical protein